MYKTIVVHLSRLRGMSSTLGASTSLTNCMGAHLIGTATSGIVELNFLLAAGAPMAMMPATDIDMLRADAEQQLSDFEVHCREMGVASYETRSPPTSAADALLLQSRYCDRRVAELKNHSQMLAALIE